jgi:two-component system, OmpR family, sensor kinase
MVDSLRGRIQLWYGLLLSGVIVALGALLYLQQRSARLREIDDELASGHEVLSGQLAALPADQWRRRLPMPRTFRPRRPAEPTDTPYFTIWSDGEVLQRSAEHAPVRLPDASLPNPPRRMARRGGLVFDHRPGYREAFGAGPAGTQILVGRPVERDLAELQGLLFLIAGSGAAVFIVGLAGGRMLLGRALAPLAQMTQTAREISATDLSRRAPVPAGDSELAQLAITLNEALERLQQSFERQVRFTADASHELRTPLSVLQTHLELALARPRSAEQYRETLETCRRATQRAGALVQALLYLARLDESAGGAELVELNLLTLVEESIAAARPLAEPKQIQFQTVLEPTTVRADADQLQQVLTNLLTNAIQYSPVGTTITVRIGAIVVPPALPAGNSRW